MRNTLRAEEHEICELILARVEKSQWWLLLLGFGTYSYTDWFTVIQECALARRHLSSTDSRIPE